MFSKSDIRRNAYMLKGGFSKCGYDWWWHSFTAHNEKTGAEKPFYIEFFTCNPALAQKEPTFGQSEYNKKHGIKPSYLMINVGTWGFNHKQLHNFYSMKDVKVNFKVPFEISVENNYLTETKTYGKVCVSHEDSLKPEFMCDEGTIEWNLKISKQIPFNVGYGAGSLFRNLQLFEMFWHAEGMKTQYEGYVIIDGEKYIVDYETSYGYADKNWGSNFTSPWVWLSSNNIYSVKYNTKLDNTVFDIGGGAPKVGPIRLKRKLLSALYYEGKCYEFNFSKFWTNTKTIFDSKETNDEIIWHVEQTTWNNKMITDITCKKDEMLLINYEAPTGEKRHNRLWNGGNGKGKVKLYHKGKLVDELEVSNVGCEYGEFDK